MNILQENTRKKVTVARHTLYRDDILNLDKGNELKALFLNELILFLNGYEMNFNAKLRS